MNNNYEGYTDDLYDNVVLLLHGDSQNGDAGQIIDSSKYNVNLTNTGPVTANTGTQNYGYSTLYFNGTSYLTTPPLSNYSFDAGNFTIEMWVNLTSFTVNTRFYYNAPYGTTWGANQFTIGTTATNFYFTHNTLGTITGTTALSTATWYHVALVRNGTILSMYVNGTSEGTPLSVGTSTIDGGGPRVAVFGALGVSNTLTGYLDDIRITKGFARYTSAFTVPNRAFFPAVYEYPPVGISDPFWKNTTLLLHGDDFTDASPIGTTLTLYNTNAQNPVISSTQYKFGTGSIKITPQNVTSISTYRTPVSTSYNLSGDCTIEFWIYFNVIPTVVSKPMCANASLSDTSITGWQMFYDPTVNKLQIASFSGGGVNITTTANPFVINTWYHIAFVRSGTTNAWYINGTQNSTNTSASSLEGTTTGRTILIGGTSETSSAGAGTGPDCYIEDLRITKGVARYTANFTPPTAGHNSFERMGSNSYTFYYQSYGNGTYTASASSTSGSTNYEYYAFNKVNPTDASAQLSWRNNSTTAYNATSGLYSANTYSTLVSGTVYNGEWLQIQCPTRIYATGYTLTSPNHTANTYLGTPGSWVVAGSNDEANWSLLDSRNSQIFTSNNVTATYSIPYMSNSYSFYRMVVTKSQTPTGGNYLYVGEWKLFVDTSQKPPVGLEYPPSAMTSTTMTFNGQPYGNGTYYITYSSEGFAGAGLYLYDKATVSGGSNSWYATGYGGGTPGNYTGGLYSTTVSGTSYAGQWHGLRTPTPVIISSYQIQSTGDVVTRNPYTWVIAGSNDGTNWWLIDSRTGFTWTANQYRTFSVTSGVPAYQYFRIIVTQIQGSDNSVQIGELRYYGTPLTSPSYVYMDGAGTDSMNFIECDGSGNLYMGCNAGIAPVRVYNNGGAPSPYVTQVEPYFNNTVLLLHGDDFSDSSQYNATLTNTGSVTLNTNTFKYGTAAFQFNGSNYLTTPSSTNYSLGTGDFTIEFWVYSANLTNLSSNYPSLMGSFPNIAYANGYWMITYLNSTNRIAFLASSVGAYASVPNEITVNTWTHLAFVRNGKSMIAFINGVGTTYPTYFSTVSDIDGSASRLVNFGSSGVNPGTPDPRMTGLLDDIRITKGYARYTSNFTPPSAAFLDQKTPTYGLVKYDSYGNALWNSTYRYQNGIVTGLSVTPLGSVYSLSNANSSTYTFNNANGSTGGILAVTSTNSKAVVVKYDTTGTYNWSAYLSPSSSVSSSGVGSDSSENVYLCGWYQGTITAINSDASTSSVTLPAPSSDGAYMVKYNVTGFAQWAVRVDGTGSDSASFAVSDGSNVFLSTTSVTATSTVYNSNGTSFGTGIPSSTNTRALIKYNSTGFAQWVAYITNDNGSLGSASASVQIDSTGNLYIWGQKNSGIATIYNAGGISSGVGIPVTTGVGAYIVEYNSNGVYQWYFYIDGAGTDIVTGVDTDIYGTVYICGQSSTGGGTIYTSSGTTRFVMPTTTVPQMFMVNITTSGLLVNFKYGTTGGSALTGGYLSVDQNTLKVYATGSTTGGTLTLNNFSNTTVTTTPSMIGQGVFTLIDQPGLEWPPAALFSNATVLIGQTYGNGQYNVTASTSNTASYYASNAFDKLQVINDGWISSTSAYSTTTGAYAGAVSTTVSGTAYTGEWIQIQYPVPVSLVSYILVSYNSGAGTFYLCTPNSWVLAGSNDGTSWTFVDIQAGQNYNAYAQTRVFVVNQTTGYVFYRLIARTIQASSGYGACMIGELRYYGYPYYVQVPGDPFFNNTTLLLHGDDLTDSSPVNATMTNSATPVTVDTTTYKYGTGSLSFNGSNYLTTPTSTNYVFGTGNFTMEFWVNPNVITNQRLMGTSAGIWTTGSWQIGTNASNVLYFGSHDAGFCVGTSARTVGVWVHVAFVRNGNVFTLYVNGTSDGTLTSSISIDSGFATQRILIGQSGVSGDNTYNGYLDDIRITKGVARYTSNFVVPAFQFPDRNGTLIEWPPSAMTSTTTSLSGQSYGNGTYVASASTQDPSYLSYFAFNKSYGTGLTGAWSSLSNPYNTSSGVYTGSTSTLVSSVSTTGEWVQIMLPYAITLVSYTLQCRNDITFQMPVKFTVAGSLDGTTWTSVDVRIGVTYTIGKVNTFTVQNTLNSFSYYRLIYQQIGTNNISGYISLPEWRLYSRGGV